MNDCRTNRSFARPHSPRAHALPLGLSTVLVLLLLLHAPYGHGQTAADAVPDQSTDVTLASELTLAQFRSLVAARLSQATRVTNKSRDPLPSPDLRPAEEVFLQLLLIQAKDAAVHQSIDRLSEWSNAIQLRFRTQTAPQLDVDVARFVEARMAVEAARMEAEQTRISERANRLLGRPPATPLVALLPESAGVESDAAEQRAKEVLTQGEELVAKLYESYQFGGMAITLLMEYEHVVYEFKLEYRETLARNAMSAASE